MIDTNYRPKNYNTGHLARYKSDDLYEHRSKSNTFLLKTFQREATQINHLIKSHEKSIQNLKDSLETLNAMKLAAEGNVQFIEKYLPSVLKIEEDRKRKHQAKKQKKTLQEKRADLFAQLAELDDELKGRE